MITTGLLFISSIFLLAVGGGLGFVWLVQAPSTWRSRLMFGFWVLVFSWAAVSLFYLFSSGFWIFQVMMLGALLALLLYYIIVLERTSYEGWWSYSIMILGAIIALLSLLMLTTPLFSEEQGRIVVTLPGYVLSCGLVSFLGLAFWAVMNSDEQDVIAWRSPTFLMMLSGLASLTLYGPIVTFSWPLGTLAIVWLGWVALHERLIQPLEALHTELNVANGDLKRALNELAREKNRVVGMKKELQETKEQKTNFLATMSHELRTPLNSIVGYSELLTSGLYGDLTMQQLDRLQKINRNGQNLLNVITDILDLSKIDAGRLELDMQRVQLEAIFQEISPTFQERSSAKNIEFHVQLDHPLFPIVGDRYRCRQIIYNLLDNGVKFTSVGKVLVRVTNITVQKGRSEQFDLPMVGWISDGDWVLLEVTDTGIGITQEHQSTIFEVFSQVEPGRSREFEGTGLGLAITRKLVELHHGMIWVKSSPAVGSTFYVALPSVVTFNAMDNGYRDILGTST